MKKIVMICLLSGSFLCADHTFQVIDPYTQQERVEKILSSTKITFFDRYLPYANWLVTAYVSYQSVSVIKNMLKKQHTFSLHTLTHDDFRFAPLSTASQKAIAALTEQDFEKLIKHQLSHKNEREQASLRGVIVTQYNLYQFPAFIAAIRTWPEFIDHMKFLDASFEKNKTMKEKFAHIQGFKKGAFKEQVRFYVEYVEHIPQENILENSGTLLS